MDAVNPEDPIMDPEPPLSPTVTVAREDIQVMMSRWADLEKGYKDRLDRQYKRLGELLEARKRLIDMVETLFQFVEPDGFRERLEKIKAM